MDEPTTHLDVGSIDALVGALGQYEGTLLFISHDVYFVRAVATTVLHINAGQLTPYAGDYDYYLDKSRATAARLALVAEGRASAPPVSVNGCREDMQKHVTPGLREAREQRRAEAEQRKSQAKVKREHEKRVRELEMHILSLEGRQREITAELEKPETYDRGGAAMELNRELLSLADELERRTQEWEALG
ncbi:MAG: ABC transporter ATP-binding protein, partial [Chthoniobacterales bacterium]